MGRVILVLAIVAGAAMMLRHPAAPPIIAQTAQTAHPPLRARQPAPPPILVYVSGSVARPGLFRMSASSRVNEAVVRAGGMLPGADASGVNLAAMLEDGQQIKVPKIGEKSVRRRPAVRAKRVRKKRALLTPAIAAVDLNTADAATLEQLPGVGPELAERLIAYRRMNGPFRSADDLADVAGLTQRRIDGLVPYLRDFQQR